MCYTTTFALGSTLITLTRGTSSLLREGLFTRTSNITKILGLLQDVSIFVIPVIEDILDYVSPERQVVDILVKLCNIPDEFSSLEVEDGHLHLTLERTVGPRLQDKF